MLPKISIIIPVYNAASFVQTCLYSLKNQNYSNFEVIIIDDGSTDDTVSQIREVIKNDSRFSLYEQLNKGVSAARNFALKKITGDYVTFIDADDKVQESYLETLVNYLRVSKSDVLVFNYFLWTPSRDSTRAIVESNNKDKLASDEYIRLIFSLGDSDKKYAIGGYVWNKIFSRKLIGNTQFNEQITAAEDELFCFETFRSNMKVSWYSAPLVFYRQHEFSSIKKTDFPIRHLETRIKMLAESKGSGVVEDLLTIAYFQSLISAIGAIIKEKELCSMELLIDLHSKADELLSNMQKMKLNYLNDFYKKYAFLIYLGRVPVFLLPFLYMIVHTLNIKALWNVYKRFVPKKISK